MSDLKRPLHLFRLICREVGPVGLERSLHKFQVAVSKCDERDAVQSLEARFGSTLWQGLIITEIEYLGTLCVVNGKPLYEEDDL